MITLQIITLILLVFLLVLTLIPKQKAKIQTKIARVLRKPAQVVAPRTSEEIINDEIAEERKEEDLPEYLK